MKKILNRVDAFINSITMYRLVLYGLALLVFIAIALSITGSLPLPTTGLLISFGLLIVTCYVSNRLLGRFWPVVVNHESALVTALILGLILPPPTSLSGALAIVLAGIIAMVSKFVLAPYRKHIFNPAAIAAVILGISGILYATWWIGNPVMLPFTLLLGLVLLRKLRRFSMFTAFLFASLVVTVFVTLNQQSPLPDALQALIASSPLIFLGTVMLTEPLTTPPHRREQLLYGVLVGGIFSAQLSFGRISSTPELALVIGNVFAYAVSPKYKLRLTLKRITQLSAQVYDIAFTPERRLQFVPGQYMEWTLDGPRDSRGNRRTFSIASAPEEQDVHIGIKTAAELRGFKKRLLAMQPGDTLIAGQLTGDFVLPKDISQKLVFVAGGIGITPFRSMVQHLVLNEQHRDIVVFYMVANPDELSYKDVLLAAKKFGVSVVPVLSTGNAPVPASWKHPTGYLTKQLLTKHVPDFQERLFYLSGPPAMVKNYRRLLKDVGIKRSAIKTDYFSGY